MVRLAEMSNPQGVVPSNAAPQTKTAALRAAKAQMGEGGDFNPTANTAPDRPRRKEPGPRAHTLPGGASGDEGVAGHPHPSQQTTEPVITVAEAEKREGEAASAARQETAAALAALTKDIIKAAEEVGMDKKIIELVKDGNVDKAFERVRKERETIRGALAGLLIEAGVGEGGVAAAIQGLADEERQLEQETAELEEKKRQIAANLPALESKKEIAAKRAAIQAEKAALDRQDADMNERAANYKDVMDREGVDPNSDFYKRILASKDEYDDEWLMAEIALYKDELALKQSKENKALQESRQQAMEKRDKRMAELTRQSEAARADLADFDTIMEAFDPDIQAKLEEIAELKARKDNEQLRAKAAEEQRKQQEFRDKLDAQSAELREKTAALQEATKQAAARAEYIEKVKAEQKAYEKMVKEQQRQAREDSAKEANEKLADQAEKYRADRAALEEAHNSRQLTKQAETEALIERIKLEEARKTQEATAKAQELVDKAKVAQAKAEAAANDEERRNGLHELAVLAQQAANEVQLAQIRSKDEREAQLHQLRLLAAAPPKEQAVDPFTATMAATGGGGGGGGRSRPARATRVGEARKARTMARKAKKADKKKGKGKKKKPGDDDRKVKA